MDKNIKWTQVENSSPLDQTYTPTVIQKHTIEMDHHTGGKWLIHGTKHCELLAKPVTLWLLSAGVVLHQ